MSSYRKAKKEENKEKSLKKKNDYQRQYRKKKLNQKVGTVKYSKNMVEDLIKQVLEGIPVKYKVGRPSKRRSL